MCCIPAPQAGTSKVTVLKGKLPQARRNLRVVAVDRSGSAVLADVAASGKFQFPKLKPNAVYTIR